MAYPDYTRNPNDSDVQTFLTAAGMWASGYSAVNVGIAAGIVRQFEQITGRTPMLAAASDASFYFDGPDYRQGANLSGGVPMPLPLCFVSISEIAYGCDSTNTTGTLYTIGDDVLLKPRNRSTQGVPIEAIEFHDFFSSAPENLRVKGKVGSFTTWPEDAWHACVMGSAAALADLIGAAAGGGITTMRDDDQTISRDANPFKAVADAWKARFSQVASQYTRIQS